jgi:hypothetical protein
VRAVVRVRLRVCGRRWVITATELATRAAGAIYDYATNSLSKVLGVPLVTGSSYANTALVNFYTGRPGMACWSCLNTTSESFEWTQQGTLPSLFCEVEVEPYDHQLIRTHTHTHHRTRTGRAGGVDEQEWS